MDPKERELRQRLTSLIQEARSLMAEGKNDDAQKKKDEAEQARRELDLHIETREMLPPVDGGGNPPVVPPINSEDRAALVDLATYRSAFEKYLKYGKEAELTDDEQRAMKASQEQVRTMLENDPVKGGYLVPEDLTNEVMKMKKTKQSVRNLVAVKTVGTLTGKRKKRRGTDARMVKLDEGEKIPTMETPDYGYIAYKVHKYAGIFDASNEMISDSAVSVSEEFRDWYEEISLNTENDEIFYGLGGENSCEGLLMTTKYRMYDGSNMSIALLRSLKNKVDKAYRQGAKWVMNTLATEALLNLKFEDGKPILVQDATKPDTFTLFGYPVEVYDTIKNTENEATSTTTTEIVFGNFDIGYFMFDRKTLEAKTTDVGGGAFENDTTLTRVIQRFDGKVANEDAIVILANVVVQPLEELVELDPAA